MGTKGCHCRCGWSDSDDFTPLAHVLSHSGMVMRARFGSQGSIALNWHSRYSGTRYSGTWLYCSLFKTRTCLSYTNNNMAADDPATHSDKASVGMYWTTIKSRNIGHTKSFSCLCSIHWSQALSRKWRCSWSSANTGDAPTTSEWSTSFIAY